MMGIMSREIVDGRLGKSRRGTGDLARWRCVIPWTRRQVKLLLSKGSPLEPEQKAKMHRELHANPQLGHARKGSAELKHLSRGAAKRMRARASGKGFE